MTTFKSQHVAALFALALCGLCPAWGREGHQVVGTIAQNHLSPEARKMVERLLKADPSEDGVVYASLADIANWADLYERGPKHYVNVPRSATSLDPARDCGKGGCVLTAIDDAVRVLEGGAPRIRSASKKASTRTRAQEEVRALAELVHYIGDLHQPLHVSYEDDRGGNSVAAHTYRMNGHSVKTDLHKVWDTLLIQTDMGDDTPAEYAARLDRAITPTEKKAWKVDLDFGTWANESLSITRDIYREVNATQGPMLPINAAYFDAHIEIIRTRLQQAGLRLAAQLNAIAKHVPNN